MNEILVSVVVLLGVLVIHWIIRNSAKQKKQLSFSPVVVIVNNEMISIKPHSFEYGPDFVKFTLLTEVFTLAKLQLWIDCGDNNVIQARIGDMDVLFLNALPVIEPCILSVDGEIHLKFYARKC